jgi:hypothetical protein
MSAALLSDDRPVDPDDEQLVAYLDGELDARSRGELEQRLLEDESLRGRLHDLQRSWDWLEQLPSAPPSDKLVESTLELVVSDLDRPGVRTPSRGKRGWRWPAAITAACLLAALLAVGFIRLQRSLEYRQQLEDLALAENVDAYLYADDLELMRKLKQNPRWKNLIGLAEDTGVIASDAESMVADLPVERREEKLAELSTDERAQLASRWDRFSRFPAETRGEIRETHELVKAQTDSESLLETMKKYAAWKATLPPKLVDEIEGRPRRGDATEGGPASDRAIDQALDETLNQITRYSGDKLEDESTEAIYRVLEQIVLSRRARGQTAVARMFAAVKEQFGAERQETVEENLTRFLVFALVDPRTRSKFHGALKIWVGLRGDFMLPEPLTDDELGLIELAIPDEDFKKLDSLVGEFPWYHPYREVFLTAWAQEAAKRRSPFYHRDRDQLERYLEMDQDDRDRFDLSDPSGFPDHRRPHRQGPLSGR